jgi:hypothetical protein
MVTTFALMGIPAEPSSLGNSKMSCGNSGAFYVVGCGS